MIKRLIFDIDDTLIEWDNDDWNTINRALDKLNYSYTQTTIDKIIEAVDLYEIKYNRYDKNSMLTLIRDITNEYIPSDFMNIWLIELENTNPSPNYEVIDTLEYLSKKYTLVILTNWFKQLGRLKSARMLDYFQELYFCDEALIKPNKESYLKAIGENSIDECIMIGDTIQTDIEGAMNLGMKSIYCDFKNKGYKPNCPIITNISDLKDIL